MARLIVQKYGGSSVADADRVRRVAARVRRSLDGDTRVVVVVSALGDSTDALVSLAGQVSHDPPAREMDMLLATGEQVSIALLAMALADLGVPAVSLTGAQAGIHTDARHRRASILRVDTRRIERELDRGRVVVVAGFQGRTRGSETTTLGRGGSDLTAVALADALRAERCEICSDVAGVYTADPRLVPEARKLAHIGYEEMLELAALGAQVLQRGSVAYAERHGVRIEARSTFVDEPGTIIEGSDAVMAHGRPRPVTGLALSRNVARLAAIEIPDRPGVAATIFRALGDAAIDVDMIVQSVGHDGRNVIAFTVDADHGERAARILEPAAASLGGKIAGPPAPMAKVSAVGMGMRGTPNLAASMFEALARARINIEGITTSEIRISVLVVPDEADAALRALHRTFRLDEAEIEVEGAPAT